MHKVYIILGGGAASLKTASPSCAYKENILEGGAV